MIKIFFLLILMVFASCESNETVIKENASSEFNFTNRRQKSSPGNDSFGLAFSEKDTVQIGETYRLKLFVENHKKLYNSDSLRPIFKFHSGDSISWGQLYNSEEVVEGTQDTAFIKFTAKDDNLKEGESKIKAWHGLIIIPRPGKKDTVFSVIHDYVIQKK